MRLVTTLLLVCVAIIAAAMAARADDNRDIESLLKSVSGVKEVDPLTSLQDTISKLEGVGSQLQINGEAISLAPEPVHEKIEDIAMVEHSQKAEAKAEAEAEGEAEAETEVDAEAEAEAEAVAETEVDAEAEAESEASTEEKAVPTKPVHTRRNAGRSMLESSTSSKAQAKDVRVTVHGWGVGSVGRRVRPHRPAPRFTGAAARLTRSNVRCVLCQYFLQRIHHDMTQAKEVKGAVLLETGVNEPVVEQSEADKQRIEAIVSADADKDALANPSFFEKSADSKVNREKNQLAIRPGFARFAQLKAKEGEEAEATTEAPAAATTTTAGATGPGVARMEAARAAFKKLYSGVYSSFETICARRMPLAYLPYCNDMLRSYRFFAQGLHYGDRPETICINGNFCDSKSYIRHQPHVAYVREPGDA